MISLNAYYKMIQKIHYTIDNEMETDFQDTLYFGDIVVHLVNDIDNSDDDRVEDLSIEMHRTSSDAQEISLESFKDLVNTSKGQVCQRKYDYSCFEVMSPIKYNNIKDVHHFIDFKIEDYYYYSSCSPICPILRSKHDFMNFSAATASRSRLKEMCFEPLIKICLASKCPEFNVVSRDIVCKHLENYIVKDLTFIVRDFAWE